MDAIISKFWDCILKPAFLFFILMMHGLILYGQGEEIKELQLIIKEQKNK